LRGVLTDEGNSLGDRKDRLYTVEECQAECDDEAGCHSFTFEQGDEDKHGYCSLKDKCTGPGAEIVTEHSNMVTHWRPCRDSHVCDNHSDTWETNWGGSPTERCTEHLFNSGWGKGGLYVDCSEPFESSQCALSCCRLWGPGTQDESRGAGYMVTQRVVQDEGASMGDRTDRYYSVAECEGECNKVKGCRSFSYSDAYGHCHLKDRCVTECDKWVAADDKRADYHTYHQRCAASGRLLESRAKALQAKAAAALGPRTAWQQPLSRLSPVAAAAVAAGVAALAILVAAHRGIRHLGEGTEGRQLAMQPFMQEATGLDDEEQASLLI